MAYNKINWEAGEISKEGYTIVDGQTYNTVQPEYSGNTPLNPENLNHMDDGIEMANRKDMMTAYLDSDYTFTTGGAYLKIPFNRNYSVGDRLTLSNGEIVVGSGIQTIKISAKMTMWSSDMATGGKNLVIQKNGITVDRVPTYFASKNNTFISMPARLISAEEGDKITLAYYGSANESIAGGDAFTFLTVEAFTYEE